MRIARSRKKTSISCCAAFLLLALAAPAQAAPPTPALVSPADGAVVASLPAFAWNPSRGAHHYEFQVSADRGFNSPVLGYGDDRFFTGNTRARPSRRRSRTGRSGGAFALQPKPAPSPPVRRPLREEGLVGGPHAPVAGAGRDARLSVLLLQAELDADVRRGEVPGHPRDRPRARLACLDADRDRGSALGPGPRPSARALLLGRHPDRRAGQSRQAIQCWHVTWAWPTTYSDETTLYYWAVLPAAQFDGGLSAGNPLLAAYRSFQKQSTPPALVSPVGGGAISTQPTFRWTAAEGVRRYRLQVSQDPTFGSPIDDVLTRSTAYTSNSTYPADTILYWRVRADDEKLVGLTWSATGTFRRTLPTAGDLIPLLTWAPITGAVSYDLEINEPDEDSSVFEDAYSSAFAFIKMTGTGVWGWRVRANYPTSSTFSLTESPWSGMRYFTRTIHEPAGATTDRGPSRVLMSWQPVLGMKNYRLQISARADFARLVENVITDNTAYAPRLTTGQAYLNGGLFYWRVARPTRTTMSATSARL